MKRPMKHIVEYADMVNEAFTYPLASSGGKQLVIQVSFMPKQPPIVKLVVRINGETSYEGNDLFIAVAVYNTF